MMRWLAALAAVSALAAAQTTPRPLEARFLGNMAFAISDGTVTLMSDFPYESGAFGYMAYEAQQIRSSTAETLSLITHRHDDHWEPSLFTGTGWKVVGPGDVTAALPPGRVVPLAPEIRVGPIAIEPMETPHASVDHLSYLVTWHGRRLYFTGDTDSTQALLAAKNLDVAFVSPWLLRTVAREGGRIDAKRVVVYHHGADERVPDCGQDCSVPRQGDVLRF